MGVAIRSSRVCFSRSRLIEPAVADAARNTTWRVISIRSAAKMPCPICAPAKAAVPPKPFEAFASKSRSAMSAKPPSNTR